MAASAVLDTTTERWDDTMGMNYSELTTDGYWSCDYYDHDGIDILLRPYNVTSTILAVIGIVINIAGVSSLLQQKRNRKECPRSRIVLLISLSLSDICTCVCVPLKLYITYAFRRTKLDCTSPLSFYCTQTFLNVLFPAFHTISLLNLLGMAIDHWITFTKPFSYFVLMSRKRAIVMTSCFWVFGGLVAVSEYVVGLRVLAEELNDNYHLCELLMTDRVYKANYVLLLLAPICLVAMIIIYWSIFREIKALVIAPPPQQDFGQAKRALFTTLVICGTFLICWLPCFGLTTVIQIHRLQISRSLEYLMPVKTMKTLLIAQLWSYTLLLANSILDPLIYMSYLRLKLKTFCRCVARKLYHPYREVKTTDDCNKEEMPSSHTLTAVRNSIQVSTPGNLLSNEAVQIVGNNC